MGGCMTKSPSRMLMLGLVSIDTPSLRYTPNQPVEANRVGSTWSRPPQPVDFRRIWSRDICRCIYHPSSLLGHDPIPRKSSGEGVFLRLSLFWAVEAPVESADSIRIRICLAGQTELSNLLVVGGCATKLVSVTESLIMPSSTSLTSRLRSRNTPRPTKAKDRIKPLATLTEVDTIAEEQELFDKKCKVAVWRPSQK